MPRRGRMRRQHCRRLRISARTRMWLGWRGRALGARASGGGGIGMARDGRGNGVEKPMTVGARANKSGQFG